MDLDTALSDKPAEGASATDILRADHGQAMRLFADFEGARSDKHASAVLAQALCLTLELHDTIEREVFYPVALEIDPTHVKKGFDAHAAIDIALEEVKRRADADEPLEDAMATLKGLVAAHVQEEEQGLFPRLEKESSASLRELGVALIRRKEELTGSTQAFEAPAT